MHSLLPACFCHADMLPKVTFDVRTIGDGGGGGLNAGVFRTQLILCVRLFCVCVTTRDSVDFFFSKLNFFLRLDVYFCPSGCVATATGLFEPSPVRQWMKSWNPFMCATIP